MARVERQTKTLRVTGLSPDMFKFFKGQTLVYVVERVWSPLRRHEEREGPSLVVSFRETGEIKYKSVRAFGRKDWAIAFAVRNEFTTDMYAIRIQHRRVSEETALAVFKLGEEGFEISEPRDKDQKNSGQ